MDMSTVELVTDSLCPSCLTEISTSSAMDLSGPYTLTKALSRLGWSKVPIGFTLTLKGEVTHRLPPKEGTLREWEWSKAWSDLAMVGAAWERVVVVVDKVLESAVDCTGRLYLVLRTRACGLRYLALARSLLTHCTDITSLVAMIAALQCKGLEVGRGDWVGEIVITGKLGFERFAF